MAVDTLTQFPASFVAGDTLRVDLTDADYPAGTWSLQVLFAGPSRKTFDADESGNDFELVVAAADSAKITPGSYDVSFIYTETSTGERITVPAGFRVDVLADPTGTISKSIARQTLEAGEAALLKLMRGTNNQVNFNGQSFTKKNLKELQDAIDRQRAIVTAEENRTALASGTRRSGSIFTRFSRNSCE